MGSLETVVWGRPRPQGSVTARTNGTVEYSAALVKWRQTLGETLRRQYPISPLEGPVVAVAEFVLRGVATDPPDLDKLTRALGDGITDAGLWRDDAQVVGWYVTKRSARQGEQEHVRLRLEW